MAVVNRFLALSLGAHVILGVALGAVHRERRHETVAILFHETKKAQPPPAAPPPPERSPPPPAPRATRAKTAPAEAAKPAPAAAPQQQTAPVADALPDFGLSLSGGGSGGLAVAAGGRAAGPSAAAAPMAAKTLSRAAPRQDDCGDPPAKPRPLNRPTPAYTADAQAAGISGKVRVEITVDEHGRVVAARILQGLGHGLDEAALDAARAMTFEPAVRCGSPTSATFKIGFTFAPPSP